MIDMGNQPLSTPYSSCLILDAPLLANNTSSLKKWAELCVDLILLLFPVAQMKKP